VVDKDLLIHHKEKLYVELKNILARQPGPEVAEQLSMYQQSLTERAKQMEQMEAELTMSHTQASEYKYEIARINKELVEVKKKFFEQRKREQVPAFFSRWVGARRREQVHLPCVECVGAAGARVGVRAPVHAPAHPLRSVGRVAHGMGCGVAQYGRR